MGKRSKSQRIMRGLRQLEYERHKREYVAEITRILSGDFEVGDRVKVVTIPVGQEHLWCYGQFTETRVGVIRKIEPSLNILTDGTIEGHPWSYYYSDRDCVLIEFEDTQKSAYARPDMLERMR